MKIGKISKSQGTAIVITMGVLMLIVTIGISFTNIMIHERVAASNFSDAVQAKFVAMAGIENAIKKIIQEVRIKGYSNKYSELFYNDPSNSSIEVGTIVSGAVPNYYTPLSNLAPISLYKGFLTSGITHYLFSGSVGNGRYSPNGDIYSLRITPLAGRLNVNSHIHSVSGVAQQYSNRIMNSLLRSLAIECSIPSAPIDRAQQLADALRPVNNNVPIQRTMEEIQNIVEGVAGISEADKENFLNNLCANSWMDPKTVVIQNPQRNIHTPANYVIESRSPVDIKLASPELLRALIRNIRATAVFYQNNVAIQNESDFHDVANSSGTNIQEETNLANTPRRVPIVFSPANATNIVNAIITEVTGDPVDAFPDQGDFENFIDSALINPATCFPSNPDPYDSGTNPDGILDTQWIQACRDTLKSNFNPNNIDNTYNPNSAVYRRVSKANLHYDHDSNPATPDVPSHTTEICFSTTGRYEILSYGRLTMNSGSILVATSVVKAVVSIYDIEPGLRHTTQADFDSGNFSDTVITWPEKLNIHDIPDTAAGRVETIPRPVPALTGQLKSWGFSSLDGTTAPPLLATTSLKLANLQTQARAGGFGQFNNMRSLPIRQIDTSNPPLYNNLVNDGLFSARYQIPNLGGTQYFAVPATGGDIQDRDVNSQPSWDISYYRGAMEFWVKLDVDGDEDVAAGLFGVTQITKSRLSGGTPTTNFKEGVQVYIFKNTLGKLRFSRLYYIGYFDWNGNYVGSRYPWDGDDIGAGIIRFKYGRQDTVADISAWKAHTWHHVFFKWNDTAGTMQVWLDGGPVMVESQKIGSSSTVAHPRCCVLNERVPNDTFFMNGFYRRQYAIGGFFKLANIPDSVHYPGNSTIDNVITYTDDSVTPDNSTYGRRYEQNPVYRNTFHISHKGILGTLKWTAYPRITPAKTRPYAECSAIIRDGGGNLKGQYILPANDGFRGFYGEGLPTGVSPNYNPAIEVENGYTIEYTTTFYPPTNSSNGSVCPALDSITLEVLKPRIIQLDFKY